jgi:hypothetical protein
MHTGIDKAWSTERQHAAMLAARHTVHAAAVSYAEHWAGWPGKQLYGAVGTCTVLSMLLPTGLICDLCTGTGSQHNQPAERNAAGRQQGNQPQTCNVCSTSCVALCMELTMTLAYGMHSRRAYV